MSLIYKELGHLGLGLEGYFVSNIGEVYSTKHRKEPRLLTGTNNKGYKRVMLTANGKVTQFGVHRLVLEAFVPKPEGKDFVHHKDHNPQNNHLDNLQWTTHKENCEARAINNKLKLQNGNQHKLSNKEKLAIHVLYDGVNYNYKSLANMFDVLPSDIENIIKFFKDTI